MKEAFGKKKKVEPHNTPKIFHILAGQAHYLKAHMMGQIQWSTMVEVRAFVTIHDENENDFQEVLSRSSKKGKISPIKNNFRALPLLQLLLHIILEYT